jgi:predicted transposase YbfD/YdcC
MTQAVSLYEALGKVRDPRSPLGRRYPLQAILSLTAVAMLSGARSLYAVAQFGRDHGEGFAMALGFERGKTPCCSALHYLFKAMSVKRFEKSIHQWVRGRRKVAGWGSVSVDGEELRGTQGHELPGVRLLAAYAHEARAAIGQMTVEASTNEHKAALKLLDILPVEGKAVVGDAAFCQRDLSGKIRKKGGDYLWAVKANQESLMGDIIAAFDDEGVSPLGGPAHRRRAASRHAA